MQKIFKYPLEVTDEQRIEMPMGAEILCVQVQGGQPCIWAKVIPDGAPVKRLFAVYGTGHPMNTKQADQYVGTFQLQGGMLVFHVFCESE